MNVILNPSPRDTCNGFVSLSPYFATNTRGSSCKLVIGLRIGNVLRELISERKYPEITNYPNYKVFAVITLKNHLW